MSDAIDRTEPAVDGYRLGVSRPDLEVLDLPTPEEVFGVTRLGAWGVIRLVIGPSLIALGISIGSGEWLLGPLSVGQFGFVGVGVFITISILLQTFYNIEHSRYILDRRSAGGVLWSHPSRLPVLGPLLGAGHTLFVHLGRMGQVGR